MFFLSKIIYLFIYFLFHKAFKQQLNHIKELVHFARQTQKVKKKKKHK